MKLFYQSFFTVLLAVFLSACIGMGPAPETMHQRMAMVQISYGVLLDKAVLYKQEGRLTPAQSEKLTQTFDDIELAIAASQEAIKLSDGFRFNENSTVIIKSLTFIRNILAESEENPT